MENGIFAVETAACDFWNTCAVVIYKRLAQVIVSFSFKNVLHSFCDGNNVKRENNSSLFRHCIVKLAHYIYIYTFFYSFN